MGHIWIAGTLPAAWQQRWHALLTTHFGTEALAAAALPADRLAADDTVVLLLASAGLGQPAAIDRLPERDGQLLERALASDVAVIPVLVDGAAMPAATTLPPAVRQLAYQHALPLRLDDRFARDAGRLLEDLESHRREVVGTAANWDAWLLAAGSAATLFGAGVAALHARDLAYFAFDYATPAEFARSMRLLTLGGCGLLGAGLSAIAASRWARSTRIHRQAQAAARRSGAPAPPPPWGTAAGLVAVCGWSAAGWGAATALPALLLAAVAYRTDRDTPRAPRTRRLVAWSLAAACIGAAATLALGRRQALVGQAIGACDAGRRLAAAGDAAGADAHFAAAAAAWPRYAPALVAQARQAIERQAWPAALDRLDAALAAFPRDSQGVFDPRLTGRAEAYRLRAQVCRQLGRDDEAAADEAAADDVLPWLEIFDGALRFWHPRPVRAPTAPENSPPPEATGPSA